MIYFFWGKDCKLKFFFSIKRNTFVLDANKLDLGEGRDLTVTQEEHWVIAAESFTPNPSTFGQEHPSSIVKTRSLSVNCQTDRVEDRALPRAGRSCDRENATLAKSFVVERELKRGEAREILATNRDQFH